MSTARNRRAMQIAGYGLAANTAVGSALTLSRGLGLTSLFWGCVSLGTAAATNQWCHDRDGNVVDIDAVCAQANVSASQAQPAPAATEPVQASA